MEVMAKKEQDGLSIKIRETNHTLEELEQRLINKLYNLDDLSYCSNDVDLLKFLLELKKD